MSHDSRPRCLYIVRDEFGRKLADYREVLPAQQVSIEDFRDDPALVADVVVPVHAGSDADLREEVDRICAERGIASVGVQLLPTRIVCGPAVVPGDTACHSCYRKRTAQHAAKAREFDVDASVSGLPLGFGAQHLAVASGLLELALTEIAEGVTGIGGTVRAFNLISGGVTASVTVAVDRCPRCGGRFAAARATGASPVPELL
ncbi:hypothetical protein GCM10022247_72350 [Allokutzneria multivorans]|uniref:Bacteriocin biosynthesis cyclodehydratase domain-containing protein n=2 Tax=Allokutzneria multivorans TaxID=1142134 RepID=A0ABP7U552_9PSEU